MQDFQPKYLQLIDHGFVGPEQRLSWVENIQRIQSAAELLPISYAIAEQQKIQLDSARDTGSLELRGSKMELKMRLLHEMDLLVFLDKLKSGQYFDLQSCSIKRLQDYNPYKLDELLDAECTLYWITLDKRDGATSPVSPG